MCSADTTVARARTRRAPPTHARAGCSICNSVYLLYQYKSTNTDTRTRRAPPTHARAGCSICTQFTCFTSTKVQILTRELDAPLQPTRAQAAVYSGQSACQYLYFCTGKASKLSANTCTCCVGGARARSLCVAASTAGPAV
jgi:hypothetical protein